MIFNVTRTSDWEYSEQVKINTLEELMKFIETSGGHSIIVTPKTIEIYDDWRE